MFHKSSFPMFVPISKTPLSSLNSPLIGRCWSNENVYVSTFRQDCDWTDGLVRGPLEIKYALATARRGGYIICSGSGFWLERKVLGWRTAFRRCPGWSQCFWDERWRRIGRRREAILQSKRRQRSMFAQEEPIGDRFWASQYFLTFTAFHFSFP